MDFAAQMTDEELERYERKLKKEYEKVQKEIERECKRYLKKYEKKDKLMQKKVEMNQISREDYITWRMNQLAQGRRYQDLVRSVENQLVHTNVVAADMVNDATPRVYAENINYAMYEIEKGIKAQTSYSLYNTTTVRNSILNGDLYIPKASDDIPKDRLWNRKKIQSVFTQSIIKGDSIPEISRSLRQVTNANIATATRTARTCMTAVQNSARVDGYQQAKDLGIDVKKGWLATLDARTRQTHRHIDGEIVELDEKFSNKCRFPGDPEGPPAEIYNCRCTLVPKIGDAKMLPISMRANNLPSGTSYEEWKAIKQESHVVNGKDISATWKRRADKFNFEIEDVMNAQGFDGLPKTIGKDQFYEKVKESNMVLTRGYTGPDQESVDKFHEELLHGKWYVKCSGGNLNGYGMYTAGNYGERLSERSLQTAESYSNGLFGKTEVMTLEKGSKIIKAGDIYNLKREETFNYLIEHINDEGATLSPLQAEMARMRCGLDVGNIWERYSPQDMSSANKSLKQYYEKYLDDAFEYYGKFQHMDQGVYAAMKGYDAIEVDVGNDNKHFVILNRTKVIILEE